MGVASGSGWNMGVVSRMWVWVESMGVASGCGCKEVYRFPHITIPTVLYLLFFQKHPYFLFIFKMFFVLVPILFVIYE